MRKKITKNERERKRAKKRRGEKERERQREGGEEMQITVLSTVFFNEA